MFLNEQLVVIGINAAHNGSGTTSFITAPYR